MKKLLIILTVLVSFSHGYTLKENGNMSKHTILKGDSWVKVANVGDVITIQNTSRGLVRLQVVDTTPANTVRWGFELKSNEDRPFTCTHNVYARGLTSTITIIIQKD